MPGLSAVERALDMLARMNCISGVTIEKMVEDYGKSRRTIERTIKTLKDRDFAIDCKNGTYFLRKGESENRNGFTIEELTHFSKEEAFVLNQAIYGIETDSSLRENLIRKLDMLYDTDKLVEKLVRKEETETIRIILEAIRNKTQVRVKEYIQASSNRGYREIYIEPLGFIYNYSRIWAYIPYTKSNIVIRLSTIKEAISTERPFRFTKEHRVGFMDPFRGYGWQKFKIKLILNNRSYGHLIDEFPLTYNYIKIENAPNFILETEVCDFYQVGRFIMSFADDVSIINPPELKEYVRSQLQKGLENIDRENLFSKKQGNLSKAY